RTVLGERPVGYGAADQGGEHREARGEPNVVAASQEQATSIDLDAPVGLHHGIEVRDDPGLTARVHAADYVPGDIRECAVRICGAGGVGHGEDSDSGLESRDGVGGESDGRQYADQEQREYHDLLHCGTSCWCITVREGSALAARARSASLTRRIPQKFR